MSRNVIEEPRRFLLEHGELHDARIERIDLRVGDRAIGLHINDIHANFRNPPHPDYLSYQHERPAVLFLEQVNEMSLNLSICRGVGISGMSVAGTEGAYRMQIDLNEGGRPSLPETWTAWISFGSLSMIEDKQ